MNMKKKLLAIAVASATAGAMTAPTLAFAGGPTLYGQAHISLDYFDNDDDKDVSASSNSSRIGVKGSQDLGNGLAAIYLMEWQVNMTDTGGGGNTTLKARNRYAGLKSDSFGTVVVGRHDTPMKVIGRKVDLFWSTQMGQNRNVTAINGHDARSDNVIAYISPNFGPVHVFLAYVTDTNVFAGDQAISDDSDNKALSGALIYDQNNLFLAVGYEKFDIDSSANDTASPFTDSTSAARATAKYNLGDWTFAAFYEKSMDIIRQDPNNATRTGPIDNDDQNLAGGGVAYKMGKNTFKGAAYWAGETDDGSDDGAWLYSAGVDHNFTKTVALYVSGALMDNDDNGTLQLGGFGHGDASGGFAQPANPGDKVWSVSTGMRIKF